MLYKPGDESELALIKKLKAEGIPVVAVFLSGRPLWMNQYINASDAFVAAWLPGSEGEGIADVLLRKADGTVQHDFKGKLSFSWPKTAVQFANNVGQKDYDPQFKFGFGLTYADKGDLAALPEASGVSGEQSVSGLYFVRGKPALGIAMQMSGVAQKHVPATTLPVGLSDDSLKITAVDHKVQEDARRLVWSGSSVASVLLVSGKPVDVSRESNGDVQLQLTLRRDSAVTAPVWLGGLRREVWWPRRCAEDPGCAAARPVESGRRAARFAVAGADVTKLSEVASIESAAALTLSISKVALGALNEAEVGVDCPVNKQHSRRRACAPAGDRMKQARRHCWRRGIAATLIGGVISRRGTRASIGRDGLQLRFAALPWRTRCVAAAFCRFVKRSTRTPEPDRRVQWVWRRWIS